MIGTVLDGRYRILQKLGAGGMGEVYLAEHLGLGRKEALKILQASLASEREFVSRFRREARATNRVQHPNIIGVYDFGQLPDGRFYLTMEYAHGERLDALLRRLGTLPVSRTLGILVQLGEAVQHAHGAGVVHRDLKPENMILVEVRGRADFLKVLDFGIAKIVAPDHAESMLLTRKGQMFGTPLYMAPEQAAGLGADPRSDLYSIGCIAFELLVGEPPFLGRLVELILAHKTKAPERPSTRRPEGAIPPELDAIVLRCLAKDLNQRFQTAGELLAALQQVPGCPGRKTPTDSPGRRSQPPRPSDFAQEPETEPGGVRELLALAATSAGEAPPPPRLSGEEAREELRAALREAAESLLTLGANAPGLLGPGAELRDAEERAAGDGAELEALDGRMADVDQAARAREAALRAAIADLRFVVSQAREDEATMDGSVTAQIRELEARLGRLSAEHERAIGALGDRAVALAAARADADEELDGLYAALARHVDRLAPQFWGDSGLLQLVRRVHGARAALAAAPPDLP
ncbi:MAG: serine/threonine protein kinase [Deltaproteobacteria bacterium]|nr:serine/threonine protein kinase [Deltaproteobacteria bacterium]